MAQGRQKATRPKPKAKRQALGRGLDALLSVTAVPAVEEPEALDPEIVEDIENTVPGSSLRLLPLDEIFPCENQPRRQFGESEVEELAASIKQSGILQPIVVRPRGNEGYEIVAGERRFRAAGRAGLSDIPAVVRELSDIEAFSLSIVENVQREDLNPIEEALAYKRLIEDFSESQQSVAERVGKNRATVANALRLLNLDSEVQELIIESSLSAGHGRALLQLSDKGAQRRFALRIKRDRLSVREAERLVSSVKASDSGAKGGKKGTEKAAKTPAVLELEDRLRRRLGTKVNLDLQQSGSGELRISFFSEEELSSVLEALGL